jgi:ketosteroid isomerase-like protein
VTESFKIPGFGIRWETTAVNVSPHGEMAYALGRTTTTLAGPDGKPMSLTAKSVAVWRKGGDGAWKCIVDVWNDDAPPPPKL